MTTNYQILQCQQETCGLRYPVVEGQPFTDRCPRCNSSTRRILERTLEHEHRRAPSLSPDPSTSNPSIPIPNPPIHALLDNIRSAWNVGSMFRTADGAGIAHIHLGGISPTPENASVTKTALGAERSVAWDYAPDGLAIAERLAAQGHQLWALEQHPRAHPIGDMPVPDNKYRLVLVVGNEVCGVDPGILELCEQIVCIPMSGGKRSLNVAVAFGIAAFTLARA